MNILCVDFRWKDALKRLGHRVAAPELAFGICDLPELLAELRAKEGFQADLIIHQERLGKRVLLQGLEQAPCPTVFISVDTHLNLFWQKYYARLFDFVLTPHVSLFAELPPEENLGPGTKRLRHAGYSRPWRAHAGRTNALAFCGAVDQHRPLRLALLGLLGQRFPVAWPKARVPFEQMMDFFSDSRLAPNESICAEVNFRLFEASSCGCLVLGQNLGEDQNVCFEPGREMLVYNHSLELLDKTRFYLDHPAEAEKMARLAWVRVHAEHLPEHRCAELLAMVSADGPAGRRTTGLEAERYFLLSLLQLFRHGSHRFNTPGLVDQLGRLLEAEQAQAAQAEPAEQSAHVAGAQEIAAALLNLLSEAGQADSPTYRAEAAQAYATAGLDLCRQLATQPSVMVTTARVPGATDAEGIASRVTRAATAANLAACIFCLTRGEQELAARFWQKQQELLPSMPVWAKRSDGRAEADGTGLAARWAGQPPRRAYDFYIYWSEVLAAQGKLARPGYYFRPEPGFMPENASECLLLADNEIADKTSANPDYAVLPARMHAIYSCLPDYAWMDMGYLAQMSLYDPQNWLAQMRYGLAALQCLRLETGIGELGEALDKARAARAGGQQDSADREFAALLAATPASEYIQRVLDLKL
ncbi:MAG: glycosyltransferase [Deltaproteobacteria bacterium]|jgi:hypothetical protein|nr:glycosyltransferase [Deltaproteobacteria bacterium]